MSLKYKIGLVLAAISLFGCAKDNASEVAINRWKGCVDSLLLLDQALDSVVIADLPQGNSGILNRKRKNFLKSVSSLPIFKKLEQRGCQIEGVRVFDGFRLYELHHFVRRLTEHSLTLEQIRERHLMVIGDLTNFDFQKIPQLTREKVLLSEKISSEIRYLVTQSY